MNQTAELEAVKRKIRALSEMSISRGASESEAMFAMKKVGELLMQYNLTMDEVLLRDEPCIKRVLETTSKKRNVHWFIAPALAEMCGVKTWYSRTTTGIHWSYFGLESDVAMALYLALFIERAEENAVKAFKKDPVYKNFPMHKNNVLNNFRRGFGMRMYDRLKEIARQNLEEEKKAAQFHAEQHMTANTMLDASDSARAEAARRKTGTQLITLAKAKRIEEELAKTGVRLRTKVSYSNSRFNADAWKKGAARADDINLQRPVNASSGKFGGYLK